jgi:hypothetical protein
MSKTSTAITFCVSSVLSVGLISAVNAESKDAVADIVAIGPLEFVDANSVTVLGRAYHIEDTSALAVGEKIAIHGNLQPDGSVSNAWAESMGSYTPGSDTVFEAGIVASVDETFGNLEIGDSKIDYTQAMSDPNTVAPSQGELVAVTGIQPELGGVVLGAQTRSGVQAVAMAIAGITGSNRTTAGITGSNRASEGITGSNQATAGITGSNRTSAGITGSNQATAGITGSNQDAAGITGSNRATAGITGSNQGTAGITGSNARTLGITGSNYSQ